MTSSRSRWSDLDRPPLDAAGLRAALAGPRGPWASLEVVEATGSTNADLAEAARAGAAHPGAVLVAEEQTAGRGRLGRTWQAPPRSGLFFSVLLDPEPRVPADRLTWLPLLAGVAAAAALSRVAGVETALKWPNDVLVRVPGAAAPDEPPAAADGARGGARAGEWDGARAGARDAERDAERKIGGILVERVPTPAGGGVVLGMGLNISLRAEELPTPGAGSLLLAGAVLTDRDPLLRAVLRALAEWYGRWAEAGGDAVASGVQEAYAAGCATLGRPVRAELPGGEALRGEAVALDGDGRLVIAGADGERHPVAAADIVHLRPDGGHVT